MPQDTAAPDRTTAQRRVTRQAPVFAVVGAVSTVAYLGLYLLLQPPLGAQWANFTALAVTAVGNTAANRRFTFGVTGARGAARHQLQGAVAFLAGLALSSGALALLHRCDAHPSHLVQLTALIAANAAATLLRFVLLRLWVFRPPRESP
ncbi:GtrA family protein [Streptacidiphilus cavernicola]|uniref:GtrA family protein n=1 Tax=Streptacidiphilus cavernicola TaxID=3342716 RepID=A0ABV6W361_9ACTN